MIGSTFGNYFYPAIEGLPHIDVPHLPLEVNQLIAELFFQITPLYYRESIYVSLVCKTWNHLYSHAKKLEFQKIINQALDILPAFELNEYYLNCRNFLLPELEKLKNDETFSFQDVANVLDLWNKNFDFKTPMTFWTHKTLAYILLEPHVHKENPLIQFEPKDFLQHLINQRQYLLACNYLFTHKKKGINKSFLDLLIDKIGLVTLIEILRYDKENFQSNINFLIQAQSYFLSLDDFSNFAKSMTQMTGIDV